MSVRKRRVPAASSNANPVCDEPPRNCPQAFGTVAKHPGVHTCGADFFAAVEYMFTESSATSSTANHNFATNVGRLFFIWPPGEHARFPRNSLHSTATSAINGGAKIAKKRCTFFHSFAPYHRQPVFIELAG